MRNPLIAISCPFNKIGLILQTFLILNYITKNGGQRVSPIEPIDRLYKILKSYDVLRARLERVQLVLDTVVKPDGFAEIGFIG